MALLSTNTCIDTTPFVQSCFMHPTAVATHYSVPQISQWSSLESFSSWQPNPYLAIIFVLFVHYFRECLYLQWVVARYRVCLKRSVSELTKSLIDCVNFKTGFSLHQYSTSTKLPSFGSATQARPFLECDDLEPQRKCPSLGKMMSFHGRGHFDKDLSFKAILVLGRGRVSYETW